MSLRILMADSRQTKRQAVSNGSGATNGGGNSANMNGYTNASGAATEQNHHQSQRSWENYTIQLAILEEQEKLQREAAQEPGRAQHQSAQSTSADNSASNRDQSTDAVQQYYRMLREEQARRIQELRRPQQ